tara:strand:+ start:363 stop:1382 length:1020 start_codon:yes stop_codon:yes gene_type:complete
MTDFNNNVTVSYQPEPKITQSQSDFLNQWVFDPLENRLTTTATVRASVNSFELGEMHTNHSGGENVFWQNNVSNINWFPVWQGLRPYTDLNTHMGISPTTRRYSDPYLLYPNGQTTTPENVAYTSNILLTQNESVFRLDVVAGEIYTGKILYTLRDSTQSGLLKFKQILEVSAQVGDTITIGDPDRNPLAFSHPSESRSGDTISVDILKEDGSPFLVKSGTNTGLPWIRIYLSNFIDIDIPSGTTSLSTSTDIHYAGDYEVISPAGGLVLTIPIDFKGTFSISDALQSFSPTSPCVVDFSAFGVGSVLMEKSKDSLKFYWDGLRWMSKDLNTKNGSIIS